MPKLLAGKDLRQECNKPQACAVFHGRGRVTVARELRSIVELDPAFVSDVYRAVFSYEERSDKAVPMGYSQIAAYFDIGYFVARRWGLFSNAPGFEMVTSPILVVIVALFAFLVMSIIGIVLGRRLKSRRQMGRSSTSED